MVPGSLTGGGSRRQGADVDQLAVTSMYVGVARAAQEFFNKFANERVPSSLGKPIARPSGSRRSRARSKRSCGRPKRSSTGSPPHRRRRPAAFPRAPFAKLLVTRNAVTAVQTAVTALGNPALTRSNPIERHLRDIHCCRIHPPQDDAALIAVGRRTLTAPPPHPP